MAILANFTKIKRNFDQFSLPAAIKIVIIDMFDWRKKMRKFTNICGIVLACLSIAGASTVAINSGLTIPTVAAASRENIDIANRDIANYLANCQQYE